MIGAVLLAMCAALFATWAFVLRPAANDRSGTVTPEELVNTDASGPGDPATAVGKAAPDVTLVGLDGPDVTIASLKGKPAVINFWASTCAPCVKEMPLMEQVHRELGDAVSFVGVDVFESPDLGRKMIASTGVTYPQTVDPTNEVLTKFGGVQLPHTVVLKADGTVAAVRNTAIDDPAVLRSLIDEAR